MKQVMIEQGQVIIEEVPAPIVEPGTILVRLENSCISIGTEMSGIKASGLPLWRRALNQPENVKKVFQLVASDGVAKTRNLIQGKLSAESPTGYSAAGTVIEVGEGITDLRPGDRVACAGAQCAYHAEIIRVPRNLAVLIPDGLGFSEASTVALGAIALQGVRRANPTLGETFVVLGLGILGQLTMQLLKANGCRVIGTDLNRCRIALASELGMDSGVHPDDGSDIGQVFRLTGGAGADGVIIAAATSSDEVVSTAFQLCRRKGRVVLVGDVGLKLNRADFYQKELDFFISSSYGPGRYDDTYEEKGLDYPLGYVRWTENRNMMEYLRLVQDGKIDVGQLIATTYAIDQAPEAYESLKCASDKPMMVLLSYPQQESESSPIQRMVGNFKAKSAGQNKIRIAVIGAGSFAKEMHLPNLKTLDDRYHIQAIVSRSGHNASTTAKQFGANYATTDFQATIADPNVDAVLIATRHDLHARMALDALRAGKHVLLEKPLALTTGELREIQEYFAPEAHGTPILLTGFNRRFSASAQRIKELVKIRSNPMIINYRMNAGYIPLDHWVHDKQGGGRNRGEACHIYDLFTFFTNAHVNHIHAKAIRPTTSYYSASDNFIVTLTFDDGSLATLTYTAMGSKEFPKEQMEIFFDGKIISLNDYKTLKVTGMREKGVDTKIADKGQKDELVAFSDCISKGGAWPIPLWQQIQSAAIAIDVDSQLAGHRWDFNDDRKMEWSLV